MMIEDLIVLGRSSPDTMKDGRVSVCVAGYSPTHGFMRLYPTRLDSPLKVWNVVSAPVERNAQDTRTESWKIEGARLDWSHLSDKIDVVDTVGPGDRLRLVQPLVSPCVLDIGDEGRSLGIVKPLERNCYFADRADFDHTIQTNLFGGALASDKHKYGIQPRAEYRCSGCRASGKHDQQILEWGIYEWCRKNPGREEKAWENLFWKEKQQEILFLVGNQARWRSSFMVISILRIPNPKQSD